MDDRRAIGLDMPLPPDGWGMPDEQATVVELDDGSIEVTFGEDEAEAPDAAGTDNLAELMEPGERAALATYIIDAVTADKESRAEWVEEMKAALQAAGYDEDKSPRPFEGASRAIDPLILEAALRFHARALPELCPPGGPVRAEVLGKGDDDREAQAQRVSGYMNYYLTEVAREWAPDQDKLLMFLPLYGSVFKKLWIDQERGRPVSRLIWPDDLVVDYYARELEDAERITHKFLMPRASLKALQDSGFYTADPVPDPDQPDIDGLRAASDDIEGRSPSIAEDSEPHEIYECHVKLDLSRWLDSADEGVKPYIVTCEVKSSQLLSVRRNWGEDGRAVEWFVHFQLFPGTGFYGWGYPKILQSLHKATTGPLRALMDSAAFAIMQGGFVTRSFNAEKHDFRLEPGRFIQVDMAAEDLAKSFYSPPFREPSMALNALRESLREDGRRIAAITDAAVGELNTANVPVGTMMAAVEQSSQLTSAIHLRLHRAQRDELRILSRLLGQWLPDEYPYSVAGDDKVIARSDFDDRVDVVPVSDPSAPTQMHRVMMAQMRLQAVQSAPPGMADVRLAYRDLLVAIDPDGADRLMPERDDAPSLDPVSENVRLMAGRPVRASISQDHDSHIAAHSAVLQLVGSMPALASVAPTIMQQGVAHIAEHMAHKYAVMMGAQLGVDPMLFISDDEDDEAPAIPPEIEGRIAKPAADATAAFVQQMMQAMGGGQQGQGDPMAMMAQAELAKAEAAKMGAEARMMSAQLAEKDSERDYEVAKQKLALEAAKKAAEIESGERKVAAQIEAR